MPLRRASTSRKSPARGGRTPAGDAFTAVVLEVFRLNGALLAAGNALCEGTGLTAARWQVLGAVAMRNRPLTVAQIGRDMGQARQSVQRIVEELERESIVERVADPDHKRARPVQLTVHGVALWAEMRRRQAPWANRTSDGLDAPSLRHALEILRTLRERLDIDARATGAHAEA